MGFPKTAEDIAEAKEERERNRYDSIFPTHKRVKHVKEVKNETVLVLKPKQPTESVSTVKKQKAKKPKKAKKAKKKLKKIVCVSCGKTFDFSGGEQKFFEKYNLTEPKHCPQCRQKRKEENRRLKNGR